MGGKQEQTKVDSISGTLSPAPQKQSGLSGKKLGGGLING